MKTETKTIASYHRLNNSVNGNPRYEIFWEDGAVSQTSSDAACAFEIGNPGFCEGDTVHVEFTRAGRVAYLRRPERDELTEQDKVVLYQLEKVDQGGDVMDLFEGQLWSVADALGLEVDDDEESLGFGDLKIGDNRWATLYMESTNFLTFRCC